MHIVFVLCAFGIVFASEPCTTPNEEKGICKSLYECHVLHRMMNKPNRSPQDEHYLRKSKCGFDANTPTVCCPPTDKFSCITPDGNEGKCVDIHSCPIILDLLRKPNRTLNLEYVKRSACAGPSEYSVCCGPAPDLTEELYEQCDLTVTALPPDPQSECCGLDSSVGDKILGGNETSITQYPWLVLIEYFHETKGSKLLCGGSLISGKYVLTAAHCVMGSILSDGTPKYVRLGEYNVTNKGPDCVKSKIGDPDCNDDIIMAPIEEIIPHPQYGKSQDRAHDIALIRIKIYAPFTAFIRPICLPTKDYLISPPPDFSFYVAGWGRYIQDVAHKIFRWSPVKRHLQVPYVLRDKCQAAIRTLPGVADLTLRSGQVCAGGLSGKDSCNGDSGGPLMYEIKELRKYEVVAVVGSGALECGQEGIPGIYTYVYEYLPWIRQNMRE